MKMMGVLFFILYTCTTSLQGMFFGGLGRNTKFLIPAASKILMPVAASIDTNGMHIVVGSKQCTDPALPVCYNFKKEYVQDFRDVKLDVPITKISFRIGDSQSHYKNALICLPDIRVFVGRKDGHSVVYDWMKVRDLKLNDELISCDDAYERLVISEITTEVSLIRSESVSFMQMEQADSSPIIYVGNIPILVKLMPGVITKEGFIF